MYSQNDKNISRLDNGLVIFSVVFIKTGTDNSCEETICRPLRRKTTKKRKRTCQTEVH